MLYAKGPQSSTRGAMILQAYLHPEAAAATAASNAQGTLSLPPFSFDLYAQYHHWIAALRPLDCPSCLCFPHRLMQRLIICDQCSRSRGRPLFPVHYWIYTSCLDSWSCGEGKISVRSV